MYAIHFRRNYDSRSDFSLLHKDIPTVALAKELRWSSGDLVVDQDTGEVVKSTEWLWDWEKQDPKCYAQRAINDSLEYLIDGHLDSLSAGAVW